MELQKKSSWDDFNFFWNSEKQQRISCSFIPRATSNYAETTEERVPGNTPLPSPKSRGKVRKIVFGYHHGNFKSNVKWNQFNLLLVQHLQGCISHFSVAVIKHHNRKQLTEQKKSLFGLLSQRARVRHGGKCGSKRQAWWQRREMECSHAHMWHKAKGAS